MHLLSTNRTWSSQEIRSCFVNQIEFEKKNLMKIVYTEN